jgi:hypothetical protein
VRTASITHQAEPTKKKDATKVAIGAGAGAALGAILGGGSGAAKGAAIGGGAGTGACSRHAVTKCAAVRELMSRRA